MKIAVAMLAFGGFVGVQLISQYGDTIFEFNLSHIPVILCFCGLMIGLLSVNAFSILTIFNNIGGDDWVEKEILKNQYKMHMRANSLLLFIHLMIILLSVAIVSVKSEYAFISDIRNMYFKTVLSILLLSACHMPGYLHNLRLHIYDSITEKYKKKVTGAKF
ncbi:hypothetical protein [Candidatus Liberibacter sp.]|uniref:hypothetical protein n=1 Tax=Candidatus Liberibacter sp. TaxID=34022 RepID=UPI0015F5D7B5|nr:hypothetical protein [Candidatus Liberibacter sp.]MBA5724593.1 hypothetical protein [Candidatus Liberibacter sp.]